MIWFMAAMFIISLVVAIKMAPKIEGQKPAGLEDFQFPTAAERPIQAIFGTCEIKGPNVLWYGDLKAKPITQKVKSLFKTTKTVIGHRYYMGVQMGLCHGPDVILRRIKFGDEVAWEGTSKGEEDYTYTGKSDSGIIDIDKGDLFGGDEKGGGVSGRVRFYNGSINQRVNAYLVSLLGANRVSALRSVAYVVLEKFYIGTSSSPSAVSFVASRYSKMPARELWSQDTDPGLYERVGPGGLDANPAYVIYEILTSKRFGAAMPAHMLDESSFRSAAIKLYDEGLGISLVVDSSTTAGDVIANIQQIIQSALVKDRKTGKAKLKLIRNDYSLESLFSINDSIILRVSDYTKGSLDTAANEVKVKYTSRDYDYQERTAVAQNNGVRIHKGDVDTRTFSMPSVSRADVAAKIAQRELVSLSGQLATCSVECNRSAANVEVGDVVLMSWKPQKIEQIAMRVMEVGLGEAGSKVVTLRLVQDVFGVHASVYSLGDERSWVKPSQAPVEITNYALIEAPAILSENQSLRSILVAAQNPGSGLDFDLATRGTGDSGYITEGNQPFTPCLLSAEALAANAFTLTSLVVTGDTEGLDSYSDDELRRGLGLVLVDSSAGREWISCKTFNAATSSYKTIQRGLLGTVPLAHPAGAKLWAISEGFGITRSSFSAGESIAMKMLMGTVKRRMLITEALQRNVVAAGANEKPWPAGKVRVNNVAGGKITGAATVTWRKRDGALPAVLFHDDDTSQATTATYKIVVKNGATVVKTVTGVAGEAWSFADEMTINGGSYYTALTFDVIAQKTGYAESAPITISISR